MRAFIRGTISVLSLSRGRSALWSSSMVTERAAWFFTSTYRRIEFPKSLSSPCFTTWLFITVVIPQYQFCIRA